MGSARGSGLHGGGAQHRPWGETHRLRNDIDLQTLHPYRPSTPRAGTYPGGVRRDRGRRPGIRLCVWHATRRPPSRAAATHRPAAPALRRGRGRGAPTAAAARARPALGVTLRPRGGHGIERMPRPSPTAENAGPRWWAGDRATATAAAPPDPSFDTFDDVIHEQALLA
jgi:hypothetical protein